VTENAAVTDEQVAWLRAYLAGDVDETRELADRAMAPGAMAGIGALVYAAFAVAARRKFAPEWTGAGVTGFVGQVRRLLGQPDELDPLVAEHELRSALGEKLASHPSPKARGRAQFILLNALVQGLELNEADVAGLLSESRGIADTLLAGTR
jgi:hypothetical protein